MVTYRGSTSPGLCILSAFKMVTCRGGTSPGLCHLTPTTQLQLLIYRNAASGDEAEIVATRVVQFQVRPKIRIRKFSRILTNFKSAVRSSVKVWRTPKSSSNFAACIRQNCKGQQPLPVQSHSFLAVKVTCSMIYIWNMICNLYQAKKFPWS